jgi:hypothetical protein
MGGYGFCTGFGLAIIGSKWTNSPWYSASDFVQISFIASIFRAPFDVSKGFRARSAAKGSGAPGSDANGSADAGRCR